MRLVALALALLAEPVMAQVRPSPGTNDPRIQWVEYRPDQVVELLARPGYQLTVTLAPDEQVQTVAVGDSAAWTVTASRAGNLLFVKAIQSGVDTNMTVITNARSYVFELTSGDIGTTPFEVRFQYAAAEEQADLAPTEARSVGVYDLSGARSIRPRRMSDDGRKTYIEWAPDVSLPAVFVIDEHGRETLANGYMRGRYFVLDSIYDRILFRIDRDTARAFRILNNPR